MSYLGHAYRCSLLSCCTRGDYLTREMGSSMATTGLRISKGARQNSQ